MNDETLAKLNGNGAWGRFNMEGFWQMWETVNNILNVDDAPGAEGSTQNNAAI